MKFTDIFIHKPVLAIVVSLFIVLLGLRSATELNVRMYPFVENSVITVTTAYVGADADLVQGFITTPLEREIATAEGIDYLTSTSGNGMSSIRVNVREDVDADEVFTQVLSRVNKLRSELPAGSEDPIIELGSGDDIVEMYLSFASESMAPNQITDYLIREVEPKLATIPGVLRAKIEDNRAYAMRVWLDPARMAALAVTASDVRQALLSNNVLSAVGATKGSMMMMDLKANTDLNSPEQFENIVLRQQDNTIVRLRDVAEVELGAEDYSVSTTFTGVQAVFVAISVANEANSLDVIQEVRRVWNSEILPQLPQELVADINYDATDYIRNAISDVESTIIEAVLIVIVVIFLFLGSMRSVIIPAVAVPLSLVGALFLMLLMGFSINLLTLLAMVLAIGIVVDDAIIILENIHRHVEDGMTPLEASLLGARELAWPVIAMTTTLVAVYLPIGFVSGLTGTLFTEFAYTLAGAVLLSGVIALTLSPMMCAKLLKPHEQENKTGRLARWLDTHFERLRLAYQKDLHKVLDDKGGVLVFGAMILVSCYFLFVNSPSELAPEEDMGFLFYMLETDPNTSLEYV
ncbi:MAG: efflux RND transporter permease subunit, partial [Porticoccaceae bacterium]|nr:efflux RND transporter permease subunit [Porticoccaceae bacterium]